MSVHRMSAAGGFRYLLRHTANGDVSRGQPSLVDYYAASGNPPGRWIGSGLEGLADGRGVAADSTVTEAAMTAVFGQAKDPVTGAALGRAFPTRTGVDGVARPAGVAGFDLTFTAVKSVSVLWALGDARTRAAVEAAHQKAVAEALAILESRVAVTRVGFGGVNRVGVRGVVAAAFDHPDTRCGDPNLHTHVVVANRVQGPDRVWRTLDGQQLFAAAVALSETYDGLVADELTRRLPVAFGWRDRGARRSAAFEVDGIDDQLLKLFSTRSRGIDANLQGLLVDFHASHGRGPSRVETIRLRQTATLASRPTKIPRAWPDLIVSWSQRARAATGRRPRDLLTAALDGTYTRPLRARDIGPESRDALAGLAVVGVQARRSTWNGWNLEAEVARLTKSWPMASAEDRAELHGSLVTTALANCEPLNAADASPPDRWAAMTRRWTTTTILDAENRLLAAATNGIGPAVGGRLAARVAAAATAPEGPPQALTDRGINALSPDQAAALVQVCSSGRAVQVLVGPAGSGKTTTLKAIKAVWNMNSVDATATHGVVGLAPSAVAAAELSTALRSRCETTAKWLHETVGPAGQQRAQLIANLDRRLADTPSTGESTVPLQQAKYRLQSEQKRWQLKPGQLLIVDEATLAGTLDLDHLTQQAAAAGAGVLLVGDHHQLTAVQAGGAFGLLARRTQTAELTGLWRFTKRWEAQTTKALRHGDPSALNAYQDHDRLRDGSRDEMLTAAYAGWRRDDDAGHQSLLIAADNDTVAELNDRARTDHILTGRTTATGVELRDGTTAGVGDRIITRDNNRALSNGRGGHVRNGDCWTVTAVHADRSISIAPASHSDGDVGVRQVVLPAAYVAEHVDLGYAITAHRVQSRTVDTAHVITGSSLSREHLYVAMTRGRDANHAYTPLDVQEVDEPHRLVGGNPRRTGRAILEEILANSSAELSATESLADGRRPQPAMSGSRPQMSTRQLHTPQPQVPDGPGLSR